MSVMVVLCLNFKYILWFTFFRIPPIAPVTEAVMHVSASAVLSQALQKVLLTTLLHYLASNRDHYTRQFVCKHCMSFPIPSHIKVIKFNKDNKVDDSGGAYYYGKFTDIRYR